MVWKLCDAVMVGIRKTIVILIYFMDEQNITELNFVRLTKIIEAFPTHQF